VAERPKGFKLLKVALATRKSATMMAFGFSSGLPYALLIGTLNAWLGESNVNLATIGVLSWIGLSYSFKFLWSPLVDRFHLPGLDRIGRRKSWIVLCQAIMILAFIGLAATNPATNIGTFAIYAVIAALASATQDVAVDAWRIDVADEKTPVELLSAIYQFGYRTASIVGGALALVLAARMSWGLVYLIMAALIGLMLLIALRAPDTERPAAGALHSALAEPGALAPRARLIALAVVGLSWMWAISSIVRFMISMLGEAGAGNGSAIGRRLHQAVWPVDHHCYGVRAAAGGGDYQPAARAWKASANQSRHDPHPGAHRRQPSLCRARCALGRTVGAIGVGRADRDRTDPQLHPVLQYLVIVRLPLLPRLSALHEGRGGVRVEGVRNLHDDDRHRSWRLPVLADRANPDNPDRRHPAGVREFSVRRSGRGRR
jgi:MFS family permease